jgi:DNA polymerase-3 subunit epsilon
MVIFHEKEPRDLSAAYKKYCGKDLEGAHASMSDAEAARDIFVSQITYYPDLAETVEELHLFCNPTHPDWIDKTGRLLRSDKGTIFGFGKHEGTLLVDVASRDRDYLDWMLGQDFDDLVKTTINQVLQGNQSSGEHELFPS